MSARSHRGLQLIKQSLKVLQQHKRLIILPFLSTLICLALMSLVIAPLWHFLQNQWQHHPAFTTTDLLFIILIFAVLFLCNLIILFFNATLINAVMAYCQHKPVTLPISLKSALTCIPQIIYWILFNGFVGTTLRILQSRFMKTALFAGISWSVVCYLVIPVFVVEKNGPVKSIKRASQLLQQNWGRSLVSNLGIGLPFLLAKLIALAPLILGFYGGSLPDKLIGSSITIILIFSLAIFNSALHSILRTMIYFQATTQTTPPSFNATSLENIFTSRYANKNIRRKA